MTFRLGWLFSALIFLSVNGQVFATPTHLCQSMANTSTMSVSKPIKIHEHQHMTEQFSQSNNEKTSHHIMKNCQCTDCDCTPSSITQVNTSLISNVAIITFLPTPEFVVGNSEVNFVSQPHSNLYRPPISI